MGFAHQLAEDAAQRDFEHSVVDMEQYEQALPHPDAATARPLMVFITACYGTGEPTDNAKRMVKWLMTDDSRKAMNDSPFAVFGLGKSKTYCDRYQAVGRVIDQRLEEIGARRIFRRGEGDDDNDVDSDFTAWKDEFWTQMDKLYAKPAGLVDSTAPNTAADVATKKKILSWLPVGSEAVPRGTAVPDMKSPVFVPVLSNRELHTARSSRSARCVELDLAGTGISYTTGDHLGVWPCNDTEIVNKIAARLKVPLGLNFTLEAPPAYPTLPPLPTTCSVWTVLEKYCDLSAVVKRPVLELMARYASDAAERQHLELLCAGDEAGKAEYHRFIADNQRDLLDVLTQFPSVNVPFDELLNVLLRTPLQHRYYSISSSASADPSKLSITFDVVRYVTKADRAARGVCSNFMAAVAPGAWPAGDRLPVFVRTSSFRLPQDVATPIICIAAGTGLAPILGFIEELACLRSRGVHTGRALIFFGCYHENEDFIHGDRLRSYASQGLIELHTAFSHDQPQRIFVQHRLKEQSSDVWQLINEHNAHVYVCGNAKTVGSGVFATLVDIAAEHGSMPRPQAELAVRRLIEQRRYQDDVF